MSKNGTKNGKIATLSNDFDLMPESLQYKYHKMVFGFLKGPFSV